MRGPNSQWVALASNEWNHDSVSWFTHSSLGHWDSPLSVRSLARKAKGSSSELVVAVVGGATPTSSPWFLDACILATFKSRSGGASRSPASKESKTKPRTRVSPCEGEALSAHPSLAIANKGWLFCLSERDPSPQRSALCWPFLRSATTGILFWPLYLRWLLTHCLWQPPFIVRSFTCLQVLLMVFFVVLLLTPRCFCGISETSREKW